MPIFSLYAGEVLAEWPDFSLLVTVVCDPLAAQTLHVCLGLVGTCSRQQLLPQQEMLATA